MSNMVVSWPPQFANTPGLLNTLASTVTQGRGLKLTRLGMGCAAVYNQILTRYYSCTSSLIIMHLRALKKFYSQDSDTKTPQLILFEDFLCNPREVGEENNMPRTSKLLLVRCQQQTFDNEDNINLLKKKVVWMIVLNCIKSSSQQQFLEPTNFEVLNTLQIQSSLKFSSYKPLHRAMPSRACRGTPQRERLKTGY